MVPCHLEYICLQTFHLLVFAKATSRTKGAVTFTITQQNFTGKIQSFQWESAQMGDQFLLMFKLVSEFAMLSNRKLLGF